MSPDAVHTQLKSLIRHLQGKSSPEGLSLDALLCIDGHASVDSQSKSCSEVFNVVVLAGCVCQRRLPFS